MTLPRLNVSTALAVYDGTTLLGHVAAHDGAFYSYDPTHTLVGEYRSQREAVLSLSAPDSKSQARRPARRPRTTSSRR